MVRVFVLGVVGGLCIAAGLHAQHTAKPYAPSATELERRKAIQDCINHEGIPVVVAGVLSSQGIGCAQPVGN